MVLLQVVSNVSDTFDLDVEDGESIGESRTILQEILGHPASTLTLTLHGVKLLDHQHWKDVSPKKGDKLFVGVISSHQEARTQPSALEMMQQQPEYGKQMGPFIEMMVSNPAMMKMMLQQNPDIQQLLKDHPEMEREIMDPDNLRLMLRAQFDPDARRQLNTSMQMQMAQINNIPGGNAMLERFAGGIMRDAENASKAPLTHADMTEGTLQSSAPQPGLSANSVALPNPWQRNTQSSAQHANPIGMFSPFSPPHTSSVQHMPPTMQGSSQPSDAELRTRYSGQLATLKEMGFEDDEKLLRLLLRTNGSVDAVVDIIAQSSTLE